MKRFLPILLMTLFTAVACHGEDRVTLGDRVVLVELFTSQGCSSCPPADELLRKIASDPALRGKVVPLAFHVDYWDRLGWKDPFSSRFWSMRQYEYVRSMKLQSAYTPQMVINGTRQFVGSSGAQIFRAIDEESKQKTEGSVAVRIDGDQVVVRASAQHPDAELIAVAFENSATTNVERGENSGRTIVNAAIAREIRRIATLDGKGVVEERVPLRITPGMGVVAFLQDGNTKRVLAVASAIK